MTNKTAGEHTQGEWKANKYPEKLFIWAGNKAIARVLVNNELEPGKNEEYATKNEAAANARLIASAPKMLEALEKLVEIMNLHEHMAIAYPDSIKKAESAIKSAKGE